MSRRIPRTTKTQDPAKASPAKRLAKSELTACAFPSSQELLQALPAEHVGKPSTTTLCQHAGRLPCKRRRACRRACNTSGGSHNPRSRRSQYLAADESEAARCQDRGQHRTAWQRNGSAGLAPLQSSCTCSAHTCSSTMRSTSAWFAGPCWAGLCTAMSSSRSTASPIGHSSACASYSQQTSPEHSKAYCNPPA